MVVSVVTPFHIKCCMNSRVGGINAVLQSEPETLPPSSEQDGCCVIPYIRAKCNDRNGLTHKVSQSRAVTYSGAQPSSVGVRHKPRAWRVTAVRLILPEAFGVH